jgi:hypothetical protein
MANRTAWTAGNGVGFTWTTAINGSDLASMPSGDCVLSSISDITNQTALDLWADLLVRMTIASSTPSAGAFMALYLYALLDDGATYGDGQLSAGTQKSYTPPMAPVAVLPIESAAALTVMAGFAQGILIPPGSFRFALYNATGVALSSTSTNCVVKYRTYNLNLNS